MRVSFTKIIISPRDFIGKPMAGYSRKNPCLGKLDDYIEEGGYEPHANFSPICGYIVEIKMLELFKGICCKSN